MEIVCYRCKKQLGFYDEDTDIVEMYETVYMTNYSYIFGTPFRYRGLLCESCYHSSGGKTKNEN